jgi:hypothetical protein
MQRSNSLTGPNALHMFLGTEGSMPGSDSSLQLAGLDSLRLPAGPSGSMELDALLAQQGRQAQPAQQGGAS